MPEGDEGWVEAVKTDDGHSKAVAHFQNRFIVWNKAALTVALDTDDVRQSVDEVFLDVAEWASDDVVGRFTDVKFNDVGFVLERDDLLKFGGAQTCVESLDGSVERVDHVVHLGPLQEVPVGVFINVGCRAKTTDAGEAVLAFVGLVRMLCNGACDEVGFIGWGCGDKDACLLYTSPSPRDQ